MTELQEHKTTSISDAVIWLSSFLLSLFSRCKVLLPSRAYIVLSVYIYCQIYMKLPSSTWTLYITVRNMIISTGQMARLAPVLTGGLFSTSRCHRYQTRHPEK